MTISGQYANLTAPEQSIVIDAHELGFIDGRILPETQIDLSSRLILWIASFADSEGEERSPLYYSQA